ncbi:transglycosylase domain-containing protein [Capnocytophaga sp.]|uniref:transglycosylase domain-containing protein n=1 Tax=Capnocytophaga sp. TaxID=44737 RepID=UPI0026DDBA79|nr:transglycosylase domain-containing protein [Capnocytophaga sp.]MDO5104978.1 transglycosylase domain-containing protein [Capnocytophaga sp.]
MKKIKLLLNWINEKSNSFLAFLRRKINKLKSSNADGVGEKPEESNADTSGLPFLSKVGFKIKSVWVFLRKQSYRFYLKWLGILFLTGFSVLCLLILLVYFGAFGKLPTENSLKELKQAEASLLYDTNEQLIGKFYIFDRTNVAYNDFPPYLINALIATEDVRFRSHSGIDNQSLMRVFFKTLLLQDDSSGGGSTITMQLAKNIFGRERRYGKISVPIHKIKEMFIAKRIEKVYSKDEILTLYLNTVPFSDNTYGIESAAQRFFGKSVRELSLNEAATLIGSLKATNHYNPRTAPEKSRERRNVVLAQMKKYDLLSDDDFNEKKSDSVAVSYNHFSGDEGVAAYFREQIRLSVPELLKNVTKPDGTPYNIYRDGLRIYTTLDKTMQLYAENATKKHLEKLQKAFETSYGKNAPWHLHNDWFWQQVTKLPAYKKLKEAGFSQEEIRKKLSEKKPMELSFYQKDTILNHSTLDSLSHYVRLLNAGFVALDPKSGAVRSYVGGADFRWVKYDHVVQSRRQVGSTFKPIVYATALEAGMPICTHFSPKVLTYSDYKFWTPTNASKIEVDDHTYFSVGKALRESINTIAVQTLFYAGLDNVVQKAKQMGIESKIPREPSIVLGTAELPLIELAKAYTAFANNGTPVNPYFIDKITDNNGKVLWKHTRKENKPALSKNTAHTMLELMRGTVNHGTAWRLRGQYGITNDLAGKTGTTQENKDGWFAVMLPELVMLTWVGNDRQIGFKTTSLGQGASSALPISALFLQQLNKNKKYDKVTRGTFVIADEIRSEVAQCNAVVQENFFQRVFSKPRKDTVSGSDLLRIYKLDSINYFDNQNITTELETENPDRIFFEQPKKRNLFERIFGKKEE